jgi:hypothetical protein
MPLMDFTLLAGSCREHLLDGRGLKIVLAGVRLRR